MLSFEVVKSRFEKTCIRFKRLDSMIRFCKRKLQQRPDFFKFFRDVLTKLLNLSKNDLMAFGYVLKIVSESFNNNAKMAF